MSTPVVSDELAEVLADIEEGLREAERTINGFAAGISVVLDQLPGWAVDGLRQSVADLQRTFAEVTQPVWDALAYAGDPGALRAAATEWVLRIGSVGNLAGSTNLDTTKADNRWTGIAADAYRSTLPPQQIALTAIQTAAMDVSATLNSVAQAIVDFWYSILRAVVALGAATVGVIVTATGVGAPAGIPIIAIALAVFAEAVIAGQQAVATLAADADTSSAAIFARLSAGAAFREQGWPQSANSVSTDARITDGDGTEWHVVVP